MKPFGEIKITFRFVIDLNEIHYWHLFISPITSRFAIGLSIFCQYTVRVRYLTIKGEIWIELVQVRS